MTEDCRFAMLIVGRCDLFDICRVVDALEGNVPDRDVEALSMGAKRSRHVLRLLANGDAPEGLDLDVLRRKLDACFINMGDFKSFWLGVVLQYCLENLGHVVRGRANVKVQILDIAWVC